MIRTVSRVSFVRLLMYIEREITAFERGEWVS